MILATFDNGWGPEWPAKQLEIKILDQYLEPLYQSNKKWVIINSTWYTDEFHLEVLCSLRKQQFDGIVLLSMLDAAIPQASAFSEFSCEIRKVGYYSGPDEIDYWAVLLDQYIDLTKYTDFSDVSNIDIAFMCLNRKPHWHRKHLYRQLESLKLLDLGLVSMGSNNQNLPTRVLPTDCGISELAPNAGIDQHGIANDIVSLGHPENWQRHFLNIVTETVYDIKQNYFVSEKIYKPIIGQRPFLVYSSDMAKSWLAQHGFLDYCDDFSDISDLDLKQPENIALFLQQLCAQDNKYFQHKMLALQDKILYNLHSFQHYVRQQHIKIKQGIQCQI